MNSDEWTARKEQLEETVVAIHQSYLDFQKVMYKAYLATLKAQNDQNEAFLEFGDKFTEAHQELIELWKATVEMED